MWKIKTSQQYFFLHKYGNISLSKDWDVINFQECFDKWVDHRGIPPEKTIQKEVPLLTAKIVKKGFLLPFDEYITKSNYLQRNSRGSVSKGDLLLTTEAPVGNLAILDRNGLIGLGQRLLCLNTKKNDIQFYKFYLLSSFYQSLFQRLASGGVAQGITAKVLKDLPLICPPLAQQKSIVSILSKQESIINNLEKVIDKKEKILKEFSHRLLSGEIRLKDENGTISMYKNHDNNWKLEKVNDKDVQIPKDWGKDKLINRDITNIKTGIKKYSGIMPYYATGDVGINQLFKPDGYYDYASLPSRANLSLKNNSIYFARMQNTKKIINNINNSFKDFILSTGFLGLSINNDVFSQTFIYHIILNDNFNQLKDSLCFGGTQKSLNDNNAKKIDFIFPKLSEQKLIADYLSKQEESIDNLKKLFENEKKKFDFLLDNLLSGKYLVENTEEEDK